MKSIFNIITVGIILCASTILGSCTKEFSDPDPILPIVMKPNMTILDFKRLYTGSPKEITDDIIIGGKVISTDEFGNFYKSFYIQDNTGGIEIKIGKTSLFNFYLPVTTVYIRAKHLFLGSYGGMVHLGERSTNPRYETSYIDTDLRIKETIFRGPKGPKVDPNPLTLSSMINDNLLGTLITIRNAQYTRQNMNTWAKKATQNSDAVYGEHTFRMDGGLNILVRTSGYAKFASEQMPPLNSFANITGVLTKFGNTYQLIVNNSTDLELL